MSVTFKFSHQIHIRISWQIKNSSIQNWLFINLHKIYIFDLFKFAKPPLFIMKIMNLIFMLPLLEKSACHMFILRIKWINRTKFKNRFGKLLRSKYNLDRASKISLYFFFFFFFFFLIKVLLKCRFCAKFCYYWVLRT